MQARAGFRGGVSHAARPTGIYRWMLDTAIPRFDSAGQFAGYIGSCLDVTEPRQDREALRAARDELAVRVAERTAELCRPTKRCGNPAALSGAGESGPGRYLSHGRRRPLPLRQ